MVKSVQQYRALYMNT